MKTVTTIADLRSALRDARAKGRIGLVPTMGALHAGHLSLVRAARSRCDFVVATIFVNPAQFGPHEDLARYPRQLAQDQQLLMGENTDLLFSPDTAEMYDAHPLTWVTVDALSDRNEGRVRPGHFRGVATVVAKLFNLIQPNVAFFGQKDAGQLALIRRMTRELLYPIEIVGCPIVRETDGVAMSSRNAYLSPDERRQATVLYRALQAGERAFRSGARDAQGIHDAVAREFDRAGIHPDYIEVLDPDSLEPVTTLSQKTLLAVAAKVGTTRLLDNLLLEP